MSSEVEFVMDNEGVLVLGPAVEIERFFLSNPLNDSPSQHVDLQRLKSATAIVGNLATAGSSVAENAGRWVKLTKESAEIFKTATLMAGPTGGTARAIAMGGKGTKHILQIITKPGTAITNPALLAGIGAVMSQYAMQQQMDDIIDYLAVLDEKLDDIIRRQKDAVLADLIGVDLIVEDALTVRDEVGRVSEVTWSKVQATVQTLARTQAYALRELEAIAEKLRNTASLHDLAEATAQAEPKVRECLAILARTFQLEDGVTVLELDRVLDAKPDELTTHHAGLLKARQNRIDRISSTTMSLLTQMEDATKRANAKVLFNPFTSPAVVKSSNHVAAEVRQLQSRLGIEADPELAEARRWFRAASDAIDDARNRVNENVEVAKQAGKDVIDRASMPFRAVDRDGDGIPDEPSAVVSARHARATLKDAADGASDAAGKLFKRVRRTAERAPGSEEPKA